MAVDALTEDLLASDLLDHRLDGLFSQPIPNALPFRIGEGYWIVEHVSVELNVATSQADWILANESSHFRFIESRPHEI